jgi:REP element-mobilizing transposase RayT
MPNHVHLLWTPQMPLAALVRQVKGPTALGANRLLGRTGEPFWQAEYFDRIVRNQKEFAQIRRYIEWNPVKAALVAHPEEFPWSSAHPEKQRG